MPQVQLWSVFARGCCFSGLVLPWTQPWSVFARGCCFSGLVLLARPRLKAGSLVRLCLTLRKGSALGKRPARRYRPPRLPRSPGEKTLANYALRYAFFIFSARSAPQLHTPHFTLYLPASGSVISVYLHVVVGEVTAPGFCGSVAKMKIDIYKNLVGRENSRRRLF